MKQKELLPYLQRINGLLQEVIDVYGQLRSEAGLSLDSMPQPMLDARLNIHAAHAKTAALSSIYKQEAIP